MNNLDDIIKSPWMSSIKLLKYYKIGFFAIIKPINILSHPNSFYDQSRSLMDSTYDNKIECYKYCNNVYYLLHRLDETTSGIIVLSENYFSAKYGKMIFRKHNVKKTYHALLVGNMNQFNELWIDRSHSDDSNSKYNFMRHIKTKIKILQKFKFQKRIVNLVKLRTITGMTHQIRIQSSIRGFPVLGDEYYGDSDSNRLLLGFKKKRLYLHASQIEIPIEVECCDFSLLFVSSYLNEFYSIFL